MESDSGIFIRIFSVILVGAISLWANHEASKGFSITIINEAKETPSGKRFSLFFESDDAAVRVLLETSFSAERLLYDGVPHRLRKRVNHVTVRFYGNRSDGVDNFTDLAMGRRGFAGACGRVSGVLAVEGGERRRFDELVGVYPEDKEESVYVVARWLDYCERRSEGFIRRLNHGMRLGWDDQTVDLVSNGACGSRKGVLREPEDEDEDNGFNH
ncbi:hypothetical protein Bca4012_034896 [Brassica carinata]